MPCAIASPSRKTEKLNCMHCLQDLYEFGQDLHLIVDVSQRLVRANEASKSDSEASLPN